MAKIYKYIKKNEASLVEKAKSAGKTIKISHKETGLARSILVSPEGKIFILFSRKSLGDVVVGKGSYKLVTAAIEIHTGELFASETPLQRQYSSSDSSEDPTIHLDKELENLQAVQTWDASFIKMAANAEYISKHGDFKKRILVPLFNAGDLRHAIDGGKLSKDDKKQIFEDSIRALSYLSKMGFLHRDIKPDNILIHRDPKTGKLTIAISDVEMLISLSKTHELSQCQPGTIDFISPEAFIAALYGSSIEKLKAATPAHDEWAFAISLAQLLGMDPPNTRVYLMDALQKTNGTPEAVKEYMKSKIEKWQKLTITEPGTPQDLVKKMLSFNPKDRPISQELEGLLPTLRWE